MGPVLAALYAIVAVSPLVILAIIRLKGDMTLLHETGTSIAFAAYALVALQPVLASRWKWIERPFGFDVVIRFHQYMGVFAVVVLLGHPPFMAWGGAGLGLLTGFAQPWYVWLGRSVLALLILLVLTSIFREKLGMTFERWRWTHNTLAVLILSGAFVHSFFGGYDMWPVPMRGLWIALLGLTIAAYVHHKAIKPKVLKRDPYTVVGVDRETHNVWTVRLAPPEGQRVYDYHPGQFHFITLQRSRDLPVEEHHWTISSTPTNREFICSTIKESGDYTATIGQTRVGDTALVEGPFGRFCYTLYPEDQKFVFIAGGIGITPFMSMIRHMRDAEKESDVLLLYANRTERDIVFKSELAEIESGSAPRLKVVHIISRPESGWKGESGRLDFHKLVALVGRKRENTGYYVCAPPSMAYSVIRGLRAMGVPYAAIRTERFAL